MANFLVGCDVGTSGAKSVVIDDSGNILGSHYIEYKLYTPRPAWAEHNPEDYWNATADTMKAAIDKAGIDAADIKGVSISALSPGCILVDKDLKPMQYSHIWMDRRGVKESEWLKEKIGDQRVFDVSANPIDPYYGTVKLLWEKNNRPELFKKTYKLQTAADYPAMKLTGKAVTDNNNAALIGIAYNIRKDDWDRDMLEEIGIDPEIMPDIYECDKVIGEVTTEAAARTGLKAGTPVMAGAVDATAGYLAGGAIHDGDWSLTMGTAGCMGAIHEDANFAWNMINMRHAGYSDRMFASVGATIAFGSVTRYFRDTFAQYEKQFADTIGIDVYDVMNLEAKKAPVGSDGLVVIPYFSGERTPIWDPKARAVIFGMSLAHTRGHFLRALMEGAVLALYDNYMFFKESNVRANPPLVVGEGGAKSDLWRQIVADVFGVPVARMEDGGGAPLGNALIAGVGSGVFKDYSVVSDWVGEYTDINEPNMANHEIYMELFGVYKEVYKGVKSQYPVMSDILEKYRKE